MERTKAISLASIIAIAGNSLLALLKTGAGIFTGSYAVLGDGLDSASDILTSVITLTAAQIMSRPPDRTHAYGHLKAEAMASTIVSFVILFMGGQLIITSIQALVTSQHYSILPREAIIVTVISIVGKIFLTIIQLSFGKRYSSSMLVANGKNMQNDILISSGVLIGLASAWYFDMPVIDRILAIVIGIWVIKTGFEIFRANNTELMDGLTDRNIYHRVFEAVKSTPGARNPHRTRVRKMSHQLVIDLDIEVEGSLTVTQGHDIAIKVEQNIRKALPQVYDIVIHVEPLGNVEHGEKYGLNERDL